MSFANSEMAAAINTDKRNSEVIIVGAGAVGLLVALKLGRAGVDTIVLESHNDILQAPRAIAYMPVVSRELRKLGVFDKLKEEGILNGHGVSWQSFTGEELAAFPAPEPVLTIGQDKLARVILDTLKNECPTVKIIFGQRCVGMVQEDNKVRLMTNSNDQDYFFEAKFVIGCDGANSAVRRINMIPFEGFTWRNFRFTAADVEYDFAKHCDLPLGNFVVDSENWAVIAKTGKEDVWRVCYGEKPDLSANDKDIFDRAIPRISKFIQKFNKDGNEGFKIRRVKPYWAHQRCAQSYRIGNVILAGDAAHSNNPVGGLGLTSGILDAVVVGNVLIRHLKGGEPDELITKGVEARRGTWLRMTNPISQGNFRRLFSEEDADVLERESFFKKLNQKDPEFLQALSSFDPLLPDSFEPTDLVNSK